MQETVSQILNMLSEKTGLSPTQLIIGFVIALLFLGGSSHPTVRQFPRRMMGQRPFNNQRRPPRNF